MWQPAFQCRRLFEEAGLGAFGGRGGGLVEAGTDFFEIFPHEALHAGHLAAGEAQDVGGVERCDDRDAADILLLKADIEAIPQALDICRATLRTIKQNLFEDEEIFEEIQGLLA